MRSLKTGLAAVAAAGIAALAVQGVSADSSRPAVSFGSPISEAELAAWNIELMHDPCAKSVVRKLPKVELAAPLPEAEVQEPATAAMPNLAAAIPNRIERLPPVPAGGINRR